VPGRQPIAHWILAFVLAISVSACSRTGKPDNYERDKGLAAGFVAAALSRPQLPSGPPGKVILPDPKLLRCSTSSCPSVLPDGKDPRVVYPWQVSLDYNHGSVIGLTALYDDPSSVDDVRTAVNQRYGKFAFDSNGKTPVNLWRVEPEKLAISLSTNKYGMVQLTYLTFDARHPTSEKATKRLLDRMMKDGN
jgi:hypothetical protein